MELQEVRNTILVELSHPVDVVPLVNRMDFAQCTYLLSVLKMEKMRVVIIFPISYKHSDQNQIESRKLLYVKNSRISLKDPVGCF